MEMVRLLLIMHDGDQDVERGSVNFLVDGCPAFWGIIVQLPCREISGLLWKYSRV